VSISKEQLEILIRIGAFRFTGMNKYQLMWDKNIVYNPEVKPHCSNVALFDLEPEQYTLPDLSEGKYEQAFDEIEILGFPLCSPFDLLEDASLNTTTVTNFAASLGKNVTIVGYYVTQKPVTTSNGKLMCFGTWLDSEGRYFDTTHFPPVLAKYPFRGRGIYQIRGSVVEDFGFLSIDVSYLQKLPYIKDDRY
jgi:DNA polymerase-3 subunit alpha